MRACLQGLSINAGRARKRPSQCIMINSSINALGEHQKEKLRTSTGPASYDELAEIDASPLSFDGAGVASLEVVELVVGYPVGHEVVALAVEGAYRGRR